MLSYNTSVHEATKFSSYEILYGKPARFPSHLPADKETGTYGCYVAELIKHLQNVCEIVRRNIDNAKMKSKAPYGRRANESVFQVEDQVFLLREKREHKLMSEYKGACITANHSWSPRP